MMRGLDIAETELSWWEKEKLRIPENVCVFFIVVFIKILGSTSVCNCQCYIGKGKKLRVIKSIYIEWYMYTEADNETTLKGWLEKNVWFYRQVILATITIIFYW